MKKHLTVLIDDKNTDLWNELSELYEIELISSPEQNYMSKISGKTATIGIYENDLSAASFTHELLHLYLKSKNVKIEEDFNRALETSKKINSLFSSGLKEHVTSCLEHVLMRPLFLEMGYEISAQLDKEKWEQILRSRQIEAELKEEQIQDAWWNK